MWVTQSDSCGFSPGEEVLMSLSVCDDGKFTCNDGSCIDLIKKCDLRVDCSDQSDESNCTLLDPPHGYNLNIPPPPIIPNKPLIVNISIEILSFSAIKTQDLAFITHMKLELSWNDHRLNFFNLKEDRSLNMAIPSDIKRIWTPVVFFRNADGNLFTNLNQGSRVECIKTSEPYLGGPELPNEGESNFIKFNT